MARHLGNRGATVAVVLRGPSPGGLSDPAPTRPGPRTVGRVVVVRADGAGPSGVLPVHTWLWCFQRVLAARELLAQAPSEITYGVETPVEFLDRLVREQARSLNDELGHARSALEEFFRERIDDRESAAAFLADARRRRQAAAVPGLASLPLLDEECRLLQDDALCKRTGRLVCRPRSSEV